MIDFEAETRREMRRRRGARLPVAALLSFVVVLWLVAAALAPLVWMMWTGVECRI